MVEVTPRSETISIRYWHYLVFLAVLVLVGLGWLWWALGSKWGAGNATIENWRPFLRAVARAPAQARPVDDMAQALRIHRVVRTGDKRYAVLFSATDAQGAPLVVVSAADLAVSLGNGAAARQPAVVERVTPLHQMTAWGERASFACVMDWSGSMFAQDLQAQVTHYGSFLKGLAIPYSGLVYKFQTDVLKLAGPSSDPAVLEAAVRQDNPQGSTALYAAVDTALGPLQKAPWLRFELLTTDGNDNVGGASLEDVVRRARQHEVSVFVLGFGWVEVDVLRRLADGTDGFFAYVPDSADLGTWFARLAAIVNNVQVAEVTAPFDANRPGSIEVTLRAGAATLTRYR